MIVTIIHHEAQIILENSIFPGMALNLSASVLYLCVHLLTARTLRVINSFTSMGPAGNLKVPGVRLSGGGTKKTIPRKWRKRNSFDDTLQLFNNGGVSRLGLI